MKKILFLTVLLGIIFTANKSWAQIECRDEVRTARNKNYSVTYDYYCKNGKYIVKCGENASYLAGCEGNKNREIVFENKDSFLTRITQAGKFSQAYEKNGINAAVPIEYVLAETVANDPEKTQNVVKFAQEVKEHTGVMVNGVESKPSFHLYTEEELAQRKSQNEHEYTEEEILVQAEYLRKQREKSENGTSSEAKSSNPTDNSTTQTSARIQDNKDQSTEATTEAKPLDIANEKTSFADSSTNMENQNISKQSTESLDTNTGVKAENSQSASTSANRTTSDTLQNNEVTDADTFKKVEETKDLEADKEAEIARKDASNLISDIQKNDLSDSSVENPSSAKQATIDDANAQMGESGTSDGNNDETLASTTSGYVSQVEDVAQGVTDDFGMGVCKEGSIFKQLACRAGFIGDGLRKVAYIIAGLALIAFSFAAIFGKVKWPVFCTIMFCCFLLSAIVFVVNTMTAKENAAAWIGGINDDGSVVSYESTNAEMAANQNVDASGKQFSDEERPK